METYGFVMCKQQRGDSAAESRPSTAKCSHGAGDDSISTPKSQAASADCSGSPGRARHSKISRQTIKRIRLRHNITVCNGDRYTVHQLEKQLAQQQKLLTQLAEQNADLKAQHQALMDAVAAQGDNLHFIALAAFQQHGIEDDTSQVAESLMLDIKVHDLLSKLGSTTQAQEPYTTRMLRAAISEEAVQQMKHASVDDIAEELRSLTMRMAILLNAAPGAENTLTDSINGVVDKYAQVALLMHVAADRQNLVVCTTNLDTMQQEEPPVALWHRVARRIQLQPQQIRQLCAAYEVYQVTSKPLIADVHRTVDRIRQLTAPNVGLTTTSSTTAAADLGEQQRTHDCSGRGASSQSGGSPVSSGDCSSPKPWQQFGYASGGITAEAADMLEQLLTEFAGKVSKLRELHRTVTFAWINTLSHRQNAINIVTSFPWLTRVLTVCQYIHEHRDKLLYQQQQPQQGY